MALDIPPTQLPPSSNALQDRGRLALRMLKYKQEAATYQAMAAELEAALVRSDHGDNANLERWLEYYSELPMTDLRALSNGALLRIDPFHNSIADNVVEGTSAQPLQLYDRSNSDGVIAQESPWAGMLEGVRHREQLSRARQSNQNEMSARDGAIEKNPPDSRMGQHDATDFDNGDPEELDVSCLAPFPLDIEDDAARSKKKSTASVSLARQITPADSDDRESYEDFIFAEARSKNVDAAGCLPVGEVEPFDWIGQQGLLDVSKEDAPATQRRRSVPGWAVSTLVHIVLCGSLLFWTLEVVQPEFVAITSAPFEGDQVLLETPIEFQTEISEQPSTDVLASQAPQVGDNLSSGGAEIGSLADLSLGSLGDERVLSPGPAIASAGAGGSSGRMSKMSGAQFFGIQATGNTFVYLVDSSGSMRRDGAFEAAKAELFRSLASLKPTQRFMVIFFSDTLEIMSLDGRDPEKIPAYATPENLRTVHDWIARTQIRGGRAPNDAFDLAIKMDPDAIFLLFDGETKVDVAGHLRKVNRVDNLITGTIPRTSIHTVGFIPKNTKPY